MKRLPKSLNDYPGFAANAAKLFGLAALVIGAMAAIDARRGRWEFVGADVGGTISFFAVALLAHRRAKRRSQPPGPQSS
jgi:hypothetical protein